MRPRRPGRAVLAAATLLAVLAGGCTAGADGGDAARGGAEAGGSDGPATPASELPPSARPRAPAPGAGAAPHGALDCDDDSRAGIDAAIDGQLRALEAGDYEAALGFASSAYRSSISVETFRRLFDRDYALLTDAATHVSGTCVAGEEGAQVLVTVQGASGEEQELVYTLVREDGAWRIAVAGLSPATGEAPVPA